MGARLIRGYQGQRSETEVREVDKGGYISVVV